MLKRVSKPIVLRPIFGLSPGMVISLAVGFLAIGVLAAVLLDQLTRGNNQAIDLASTQEQPPIDVFAEPEPTISRVQTEDAPLAWMENAAPFSAADTTPRLAIIVVDDGKDSGAALAAMRLSSPITLAIAPTADSAAKRADTARRFGREVLLLLPMESRDTFDTSPNPIAINVPRDELLRRLRWNLAQISGYVGVMNHFGETTTRDAETMRTVLEAVQAEGLSFVDARTHKESLGSAVARRLGVPSGDSVVSISRGANPAELTQGLNAAVRHSEKWGTAIISVPADRKLISALGKWLERPRSGVKIAPVTAVIRRLRSAKS